MKHLAAYCLLVLGGKADPTADDVARVLKDSGVTADKASIESMIKALKGKKLHDLVKDGSKHLASISAPAAAGPVAATQAAPAGKAAAKEEKPEKKEEEADVDMGGLFGEEY